MAVATSIIGGLLAATAAGISAVSSMKQAHDQKKAAQAQAAAVPTFDANAEKKKAAMQEAEANKKRVLAETDTVRTTALGNTGTTETKKKTLLGG